MIHTHSFAKLGSFVLCKNTHSIKRATRARVRGFGVTLSSLRDVARPTCEFNIKHHNRLRVYAIRRRET
jgi:hypothetical protein